MEKKTIFPNYDLIEYGKVIDGETTIEIVEIFTYIRKKNLIDKKWYLIPVRRRFEFLDKKDILRVLTSFIESCYRIYMLHIIGGNSPTDWIFNEELDKDQRDERHRLNNYLNFNVEVL